VARIAGCSEFHFARLFRAETGQSLRGYRKRLRLRLALKLISEGQDNLTLVALDSGFSTHSHLTSAFREAMGRTPSAARALISLTRPPSRRAG
jgi:AraC-like DNA-binding protein